MIGVLYQFCNKSDNLDSRISKKVVFETLTVSRILSFCSHVNLSNIESVLLGLGPSTKFPKRNFSFIILFIVFLQYGEFWVAFFLAFGSDKPSPIRVKMGIFHGTQCRINLQCVHCRFIYTASKFNLFPLLSLA